MYQEAFYVFLKKLKQGAIKNTSNLCGFLFTIARNKWLETRRKSGESNKELSWDPILIPLIGKTEDSDLLEEAENAANRIKKAQLILTAMNKLGEKCRKLLIETIVYKTPLKQLQEELGFASYGATKVAKHQCKKSLIGHIKKL